MANNKKSKKKVIIFSLIGAVLIVLVLLVVLGSKREVVVSVQTEKISRRTITQSVTATGKISPEVQVVITPEVSGEIIQLPVKEGMKVKKGDLMMKIKPDIYIAMRDQANAGLLSAKASRDRAESEYKRSTGLFAKGLISSSELELAKTNFDVASGSYNQSLAGLNQADESLRKTTIYAPMDGIVSQLQVELGERVLGTSQFQGTTVMTVADLSRMEARVNVSENDVTNISVGDTARISVDAFPDRKFNAIVYEIANTGTTTGQGTQEEVTNFLVKIRISNENATLRPGMSMTATIETETKLNVMTVPIQSVTVRSLDKKKEMTPDEQKDDMAKNDTRIKQKVEKPREVIFVVENGVAKAIEVKRGIADDSFVEVTSSLQEGKEVISGSYKAINRELEDGTKVKVENNKPKPGAGDKQTS
ncbi:MAG: efflux RND transporter periplasmic adaptor subunit [Bacteroidota bacterium]